MPPETQALVRMLPPPPARIQALPQGATRARVVMVLLGLTILLVADATLNGPLANLRNWVF